MSGVWDRPVQRAARLLAGLVLYGLSLGLLVKADLGLDPWNVLHQGLSERTGLSLGQITVLASLVVLAAFVPLRQRPGIGTVGNALLVGPFLDLFLAVLPAPHQIAVQAAFLAAAVLGTAVATGLYVGAGWGPGPRDGLMTGLAARGIKVYVARGSIELSVLIAGWLLGGSVGVGTVLFAVLIGPLVQRALRVLALRPSPVPTAPPAGG